MRLGPNWYPITLALVALRYLPNCKAYSTHRSSTTRLRFTRLLDPSPAILGAGPSKQKRRH